MNSTLPSPRPEGFDTALKAGYVRETFYDAANAVQFRKSVASYIQDANVDSMTPNSRYTLAYEVLTRLLRVAKRAIAPGRSR